MKKHCRARIAPAHQLRSCTRAGRTRLLLLSKNDLATDRSGPRCQLVVPRNDGIQRRPSSGKRSLRWGCCGERAGHRGRRLGSLRIRADCCVRAVVRQESGYGPLPGPNVRQLFAHMGGGRLSDKGQCSTETCGSTAGDAPVRGSPVVRDMALWGEANVFLGGGNDGDDGYWQYSQDNRHP